MSVSKPQPISEPIPLDRGGMRLKNFVPSGPPEVSSVRKWGVRLPNLKSMEIMEVRLKPM